MLYFLLFPCKDTVLFSIDKGDMLYFFTYIVLLTDFLSSLFPFIPSQVLLEGEIFELCDTGWRF